jgi:hypothetical protein
MRTIAAVKAKTSATIALRWSDGTRAEIDLSSKVLRLAHFGAGWEQLGKVPLPPGGVLTLSFVSRLCPGKS